jgi:hypothetical protein
MTHTRLPQEPGLDNLQVRLLPVFVGLSDGGHGYIVILHGSHASSLAGHARPNPDAGLRRTRNGVWCWAALLPAGRKTSTCRACDLLGVSRRCLACTLRKHDQGLVDKLMELARQHPRFGSRRLWVMLRRQGQKVNLKRIRRLCCKHGLLLRFRRRRKRLGRGLGDFRVAHYVMRKICKRMQSSAKFAIRNPYFYNDLAFRPIRVIDSGPRGRWSVECGPDVQLPAPQGVPGE